MIGSPAPGRTRRVIEAFELDGFYRLLLACGHETTRSFRYPARIGPRKKREPDPFRSPLPPPGRAFCETCGRGEVLLPGQGDVLEELGFG